MASTAQIGRALGGPLGLFFGLRERDRRRKKRVKAKADLDEKKLQELREKELQAARRKAVFEGVLAPEQERNVLSSDFGIEPTQKQQFIQNVSGGIERGETRLDPSETKIFREEKERERLLSMLERFGVKGTSAVQAGAIGAAKIPGLERTQGDIATQAKTEAGTGKLEAETRLVEKKILTEQQRAQSFKQLAEKRKRVESARGSGKKSEQMSALRTLQSGFVTRIKSLDRIIEFDPFDVEEGTNTARQERAGLLEELLGVTKELRTIGGVKETKIPKRVNQSDITKMSIDELFEVLTKK